MQSDPAISGSSSLPVPHRPHSARREDVSLETSPSRVGLPHVVNTEQPEGAAGTASGVPCGI